MQRLHTYIFGFTASLVLTATAFALVQMHLDTNHVFPTHEFLYPALVILAIVQLVVQLFLFLHIGDEPKPRFNLMALLFALLTVSILVGGTLWIMYNLSHMQATQGGMPFMGGDVTPQAEDD